MSEYSFTDKEERELAWFKNAIAILTRTPGQDVDLLINSAMQLGVKFSSTENTCPQIAWRVLKALFAKEGQ